MACSPRQRTSPRDRAASARRAGTGGGGPRSTRRGQDGVPAGPEVPSDPVQAGPGLPPGPRPRQLRRTTGARSGRAADRSPSSVSPCRRASGAVHRRPCRPAQNRVETIRRRSKSRTEGGSPFVRDDNQSFLLANAWYSTRDLAAWLRVNTSTLRRWRTARPPQGPPFVAVSERVIMYSAVDVEEWLRRHRTVPRRDA
ncbi:helix-turn-helix domain-containing protein [Streptomyces anulatus]